MRIFASLEFIAGKGFNTPKASWTIARGPERAYRGSSHLLWFLLVFFFFASLYKDYTGHTVSLLSRCDVCMEHFTISEGEMESQTFLFAFCWSNRHIPLL